MRPHAATTDFTQRGLFTNIETFPYFQFTTIRRNPYKLLELS